MFARAYTPNASVRNPPDRQAAGVASWLEAMRGKICTLLGDNVNAVDQRWWFYQFSNDMGATWHFALWFY